MMLLDSDGHCQIKTPHLPPSKKSHLCPFTQRAAPATTSEVPLVPGTWLYAIASANSLGRTWPPLIAKQTLPRFAMAADQHPENHEGST